MLILYSRPVCHLCEVAKKALRPLLREHDVALVERNVESRPEWERRYGEQIPVGLLDGRRVFKYRVDPERLRRALRAPRR